MEHCKYKGFKAFFPPETKIINISGTTEYFEALLRSPCNNKEEFSSWLRHYEYLSKVTFRISVTRPRIGKTVLYKAVYRCQHNTYPNSHTRVKTPHKKHAACLALLRVTIKSPVENRRVRSKDDLRGDYPTLITIIHKHNHDIISDEAQRLSNIPEQIKTKLMNLFKSHYLPNKALEILKQDDCFFKSAYPDIQTVYALYYSNFKKEFRVEKSSLEMIAGPKMEGNESVAVKNETMDAINPVKIEADGCSCPVGKSGDACIHHSSTTLPYCIKSCNDVSISDQYGQWTAYDTKVSKDWSGNLTFRKILYDEEKQHVREPSRDSQKDIEYFQKNPNWSSLQQRFDILFTKWKRNSSGAYHTALEKAVSYLENCETESASISALRSLSKQSVVRKKLPTQGHAGATSGTKRKKWGRRKYDHLHAKKK